MSALSLRPVVGRQLFRTGIRRYATESTTQQATQSAKSSAQSAATSAQSTAQSAATSVQSSASSAASSAQQTAANTLAKAQELVNRGVAAAGPMASKMGESITNAAAKVPGGGNNLISRVQSVIPPTVYYSKVVAELGKQIFHTQKMSPPSLEAFQKFYAPYVAPLLNPSGYLQTLRSLPSKLPNIPEPTKIADQVRNIPGKDWAQYGVWAAEFLGFFTVGQMIGRRKIVGYRGKIEHH